MKNCLRNYWAMMTLTSRIFWIISTILMAVAAGFSTIPKPAGIMTLVVMMLDVIPVILTDMFSFAGIWDTGFRKTLLIRTSPRGEDFVQKAVIGDMIVRAVRKLLIVLVAVAVLTISVKGDLTPDNKVAVFTMFALVIGFWGVDGLTIMFSREKSIKPMYSAKYAFSNCIAIMIYTIGYLGLFLTGVINLASDKPDITVVFLITAISVVLSVISAILLCTRTKKKYNRYIEEA